MDLPDTSYSFILTRKFSDVKVVENDSFSAMPSCLLRFGLGGLTLGLSTIGQPTFNFRLAPQVFLLGLLGGVSTGSGMFSATAVVSVSPTIGWDSALSLLDKLSDNVAVDGRATSWNLETNWVALAVYSLNNLDTSLALKSKSVSCNGRPLLWLAKVI